MREGDSEHWVYEDRQIVTTGLNAVAGKRREEFSPEPITYDDMRPGCYEPAARVADMDQGHVLSSLLFPSFPRYCGQVFHEAKDKLIASFEKRYVKALLDRHQGNVSRAAKEAGLSRNALYALMKRAGLTDDEEE